MVIVTAIRRRVTRSNVVLWSLCIFPIVSLSHCFVPLTYSHTKQKQTLLSGTRLTISTRKRDASFLPTNSTAFEGLSTLGSDFDDACGVDDSGGQEQGPEWWKELSNQPQTTPPRIKLPPLQIDDPNLLFYDIFLLLNLVVSISYWVVHRMQIEYITLAFNEGCLLSILWVVAGLYHGAFLYSAVDGHASTTIDEVEGNDENDPPWEFLSTSKAGPPAAGLLALNTFINTISLRLIVALAVAVIEHRPVFDDPLEQLIPLEVGFGLILMSSWRTIHSAFSPRI